jgi:hypothetical protein
MSIHELLIRGLVADYNVACSACGTRFRQSSLRVLRHEDDLWHIRGRCPRCAAVTLLLVKLDLRNSNGDPTLLGSAERAASLELTAEETQRFAEATPIGADDVLAMSEWLATFDGNFRSLLDTAAPSAQADDSPSPDEPR